MKLMLVTASNHFTVRKILHRYFQCKSNRPLGCKSSVHQVIHQA